MRMSPSFSHEDRHFPINFGWRPARAEVYFSSDYDIFLPTELSIKLLPTEVLNYDFKSWHSCLYAHKQCDPVIVSLMSLVVDLAIEPL